MKRTEIIVVGAGQAGLAMSHCLSQRGIEHAVLERGRIGERWQSERWDSLRLLTPNWMARLPGGGYRGPDPHGFMTMFETVRFLKDYAHAIGAPVEDGTAVISASLAGSGYHIVTDRGEWSARGLVVATGHCDVSSVPIVAENLSPHILQVAPNGYRRPDQLPDGGVLVVGASATGIQLAEEIHESDRRVTLSAGKHTRLPRFYRGRDILWWLDQLGSLRKPRSEMPHGAVLREEPSLQLIGSPEHRSIDLAALRAIGVRLVGRLSGMDGTRARFDGDLCETTAAADRRLTRILGKIDTAIGSAVRGEAETQEPTEPVLLHADTVEIDLEQAGIKSVVWATGYRRLYPWLKIPVLDRQGEIVNESGICPVPGLYVLGLNFLRRRNSSFIDGVGHDAEALAAHIAAYLVRQRRLQLEPIEFNFSAAKTTLATMLIPTLIPDK
ncbi:MAG: NAD(P)-binding domain-containing protein [Phyllobacterium sp.]